MNSIGGYSVKVKGKVLRVSTKFQDEETGEELDINLSRIFKESEEEERSGRVIPLSIVPPSGIKS